MMASASIKFERTNGFYRTTYVTLMFTVILLMVSVIAMVLIVLYQILHRPLPAFNVVAPNQQSMELTAFEEPNFLPDTLLKWAKKAAVAAYTFDFVNYNKQLSIAQPYFTDAGWQDYQAQAEDLIRVIAQKQLFVNGVVTGTPVISNQGELGARGYVWRIQMPFLVSYQTAENVSKKGFFVTMTIVKVPTNLDPTGIGIDQFVMK